MAQNTGRKTIISVIVSLSLILFLLYRVGLSDLWESIKQVDGYLLVIACLITVPNEIARAFRWSRILNAQKIKLSLQESLQYFLMGLYAAVLTPGRVGDLLRSYLVSRKEKKSFGYITASVVFDRMLDLGTMAAISALGVLFFLQPEQWNLLRNAVIVLAVFGILGIILLYIVFSTEFGKLFLSKIGTAFIKLLPKAFKTKINLNSELDDFFAAIELYRSNYGNLALAAVFSVAAWIIYGFQGYILFLAFKIGESVSFWIILFIVAFSAFSTLVPFTISGVGVREALFIAFFGSIGITEAHALSFSLLFYTIAAWIPALFGGLLLSKRGMSRRDITESPGDS